MTVFFNREAIHLPSNAGALTQVSARCLCRHPESAFRMLKESPGAPRAGMAVDAEEAQLHHMSTLTEEGVMSVKQAACDRLLASRVETKLQVGHL